MADISINRFKSKLPGGGARANLYEAIVNFPSAAGGDVEYTSFMIKAAALPASVIAPIEVNYRGRKLQLAGDRTFEPWTITVINDVNMKVRSYFENWSNYINDYITNTGEANFLNYEQDMEIHQLGRNGERTKSYYIYQCWPTNISAVDVGNDNENTISEFTVELQMLQFTPDVERNQGAT